MDRITGFDNRDRDGAKRAPTNGGGMRVYQFFSYENVRKAIQAKRLKISRLGDLNDPFELMAFDHGGYPVMDGFERWKCRMDDLYGVLCFSKNCQDPLLWSHYANKHKGVCLGFNINDEDLADVEQVRNQSELNLHGVVTGDSSLEEFMMRLLVLKFEGWRYEDEVRIYCCLNENDADGNYYIPFSAVGELKEIIVGARFSTVEKIDELRSWLTGVECNVSLSRGEISQDSFKIMPYEAVA